MYIIIVTSIQQKSQNDKLEVPSYTKTTSVSARPRVAQSKFVKSWYQNIQLSIQHGERAKHCNLL